MRAKLNAQPNQSLIDGITILQAVAVSKEPVGCRELARHLGYETSRVNRLLKTLAYLGIVRQTANRKYTPGPGMHVLAAQSLYASGFIQRAMPTLESLQHLGLTTAMGVLWKTNVSFLYHARPGMKTTEGMGRIGLYPATSSGIGIVLLAAYDDDHVRELYPDDQIPGFPKGFESLMSEIRHVRTRGYARLCVKPEVDQFTVAITVGNPIYAAIGLSGWIPEGNTESVVLALKKAADELAD